MRSAGGGEERSKTRAPPIPFSQLHWAPPMCGGEGRWAAHKERAAKEPSADGGSVDSRGLFSGGHLQGQALILIIRDALGTLRRAQSVSIALANFTSLDRFLLVGGPDSFCHPPTHPGQIEVWHQRISISCWAGACAVGRCGRRMSVKNMQCDQRGARSGARRERRPSPFPSCTRPRLCVVVKGGGQRTRREQQRSPAPMGGQLTPVGFSAVDTYRGRP